MNKFIIIALIFIILSFINFNPLILGEYDYVSNYNAGNNPTDLITFDCDNDGDIDIITANGNNKSISVLKNNGNGTFLVQEQYNTDLLIDFIETGDIDNDGDQDIICTGNFQNNLSILINNGKGEFIINKIYSLGNNYHSAYMDVCVRDFDNDDYIDIAITNYAPSKGSINILFNEGDWNFSMTEFNISGKGVFTIFPFDLNNDGYIDIATGNGKSYSISFLLNNKNRTFNEIQFANIVITEGYNLYIADINSDFSEDIILSRNGLLIYPNNGFNNFSLDDIYPTNRLIDSINIIDIDEDDDNDIIITSLTGSYLSIFFNQGNGSFSYIQNYSINRPGPIAVADIDGDNNIDIITANELMSGSVSILFNNGKGVFAPDNDNDGIPDFDDNDDDNDGYNDDIELNETPPSDPLNISSIPKDNDKDYTPDSMDPDDDNDGILDENDNYPFDQDKWEKEKQENIWSLLSSLLILILIIIFFILILIILLGRKKNS